MSADEGVMRQLLRGFTSRKSQPQQQPQPEERASATEAFRTAVDAFRRSGLFLGDWYLHAYPDISGAHLDPFRHFMEAGWKEGRKPNPYFDTAWYMAKNPDVPASGLNPLVHYWRFGESQNRQP